MKAIFRHILFVTLALSSLFGAGSCTDDASGGSLPDESYMLVLHVSPVAVAETLPTSAVTEKIKTLRVVVLNDTSLELNKLITVDDPETVIAAQFRYDVSVPTTAGKKEIFLIANEQSVTDISYQQPDAGTLPGGLPDTLEALMESYAEGADAGEFRTVMEAVCFAPDYTADDSGALYLPYVSRYDDIEALKGEVTTVRMFLVPVATKFTFNFVNNRENQVEVNNITVKSADSVNFLAAHVGSSDMNKSFEGKSYYWIDWLARVSAASQSTGGYYENEDFNNLYGWISDFSIPTASKSKPAVLLSSDNAVYVPAMVDEVPGELVYGPCYLPESRNLTDLEDETVTDQIYYLTLGLHDVTSAAADDPKFNDVVIPNLKSLFRNTSVIIRVTMSQGTVAVYAEIADWTVKSAGGWVVEGEEGPKI